MELQFDKEIDAILRKARQGVADGAAASGHIDADAVAAFAENALPEKARVLYMEHFADCGRCRKLLAEAVPWPPAEKKAASLAAPAAPAIPWYSRLFRTPSLAVAMGAFILIFGGLLAFLVVDRNRSQSSDTVSQMMNAETRADAPYSAQANSNLANSALAANVAANVAAEAPQDTAKTGSTSVPNTGRGPANEPAASGTASGFSTDGVTGDQPAAEAEPKAVGSAPPPAASEKPSDDERARKDDDKSDTSRDMKLSKAEEDRMNREGAPAASKKAPAGPNRSLSGPRQNVQQNVLNDSTGQGMIGGATSTPVKNAGGKKFEKRDGVWYDTAYNGQWTKNYARGSDAYKQLDEGLRSIASKIGGVVVIVWKGIAYRIQ